MYKIELGEFGQQNKRKHFYHNIYAGNLTMRAYLCVLDDSCSSRQLCGGNQAATERMIQFGRELQALSEQLCRQYGKNATHKKMLQVGEDEGKKWTEFPFVWKPEIK